MTKIKGLKKAIGEYKTANKGGYYDPYYGKLMFDKSTGKIWCDEFVSIGHNDWKEYHDSDIIDVVSVMCEETPENVKITMKTVKAFCESL